MPKSIHFICKGRKHICRIEGTTYLSGYWNIDADTAQQLVGGMPSSQLTAAAALHRVATRMRFADRRGEDR
jgi:hypothetical protein